MAEQTGTTATRKRKCSFFCSVLKCVVVCGRGCVHSPKCGNHFVAYHGNPSCLPPFVEVKEEEIIFCAPWKSFLLRAFSRTSGRTFLVYHRSLGKTFRLHRGRRRASCSHFIAHRENPFLFFPFVGPQGKHFWSVREHREIVFKFF